VIKKDIKLTYVLSFILIIALSLVFFILGRLPGAIIVFKENIEVNRLNKQLFEGYNVMDDTFHFELPGSWDTYEASFAGGEILYHMNFISQDKRIHGFVQVWNISEPLEQFIQESKKSAVGVVDFKYFDIKEIMVDNKIGYIIDYSRANQKGEYNRAYEAFVQGFSNKVYRMSFYVSEKEWKDYYKAIFDRMIHSIRIKKE